MIRFRIEYSIIIGNEEYPKVFEITTRDRDKAVKQLEKQIRREEIDKFTINKVEEVSG